MDLVVPPARLRYKLVMATRSMGFALFILLASSGAGRSQCRDPSLPPVDEDAISFLNLYRQQKYQAASEVYETIAPSERRDFAYCCRLADIYCKTKGADSGNGEFLRCAKIYSQPIQRCQNNSPYKRPTFWIVLSSIAVAIGGSLAVGLAVGLPFDRFNAKFHEAQK